MPEETPVIKEENQVTSNEGNDDIEIGSNLAPQATSGSKQRANTAEGDSSEMRTTKMATI